MSKINTILSFKIVQYVRRSLESPRYSSGAPHVLNWSSAGPPYFRFSSNRAAPSPFPKMRFGALWGATRAGTPPASDFSKALVYLRPFKMYFSKKQERPKSKHSRTALEYRYRSLTLFKVMPKKWSKARFNKNDSRSTSKNNFLPVKCPWDFPSFPEPIICHYLWQK